MKHLRYLNLSRTDVTQIPESVCNLYNLQTLIVSGCKSLIKLPDNFSKLKNLHHFDMRDTPLLEKIPLGISELKSLRTLSKLIIGGENGYAITDLKNLQNLHGKVSIQGLGNVENALDAREANLLEKRLSGLELDWGDVKPHILRTGAHEKKVLNELKPCNGTLEKLKIMSYGGTEFPSWVGDHSFLRLSKVSIYGCEECISLPRLGQLPSLKELHVNGMSKVKIVDWELLGTGVAFPSLEILSFNRMLGWEVWSTNSRVVDVAFPCLQDLSFEDCPNLFKVSLKSLRSLRVLKVRGCGHGVLKCVVDVASSLRELGIDDISGLTDELWRGVIQHLREVEEVTIHDCMEMRYLWESDAEASKALVKLRNLIVRRCSNLVSLGEKEEDDCGSNLTSLRSLDISSCISLEHCRCPDNVEVLSILNCDSITSVSFTGGGKELKSLDIVDCKKLVEKEYGGGEKTRVLINASMRMLQHVFIMGWQNLKSIDGLSCFIHLRELIILDCPGLESFPDHELPNLTSLESLRIKMCTNMDASFPRGLWPPKLSFLQIGGFKKHISEWGPQNFPTSLVHLRLWGGPHDDVSNFDELSHLFPSSLTELHIYKFEKVESVSMGLQHLTSLQRLFIFNCPKTIDLPKLLLPSLLCLTIYGCPTKLKERISRGGSYWPLVSVIPWFQIDGESQN